LPSGIEGKPILLIKNKVDLTNDVVGVEHLDGDKAIVANK
jgi:hypothetical protein